MASGMLPVRRLWPSALATREEGKRESVSSRPREEGPSAQQSIHHRLADAAIFRPMVNHGWGGKRVHREGVRDIYKCVIGNGNRVRIKLCFAAYNSAAGW